MAKLHLALLLALAVGISAVRPPEITFTDHDGSKCTIMKEGTIVSSKDCELRATDPSLAERVTVVETQVADLVGRVEKLETAGPPKKKAPDGLVYENLETRTSNGKSSGLLRWTDVPLINWPYTLTTWIKPSDWVSGHPEFLGWGETDVANSQLREWRIVAKNQIQYGEHNTGWSALLGSTPNNLDDGSWHFVAVVIDAQGNLKMYADGSEITSGKLSQQGALGSNPQVVSARMIDGNPDSFYKGQIQGLRMFDRALTNAEVSDVMGLSTP